MNIRKFSAILAAMLLALIGLIAGVSAEQAEAAVEDWYFAGSTIDGTYISAEQLGSYMHIQLRPDGTAANIPLSGDAVVGTWRMENEQLIITFSDSDAVFTNQGGLWATTVGQGDMMYFGREPAGTYLPGNLIEAKEPADFNGTWNVKWMWMNGAYQSVEYLRYNFDLETLTVVLEDGVLKTSDTDYGLAFSEGLLYFTSGDELQMIFGLQDDGMLCYADKTSNIAYYCEKVE